MSGVEFRNAAWMARSVGRGSAGPFDEQDLEDLARGAGVRTVPPGTPLLTADGPVDRLVLVRRGEVELSRRYRGKRVSLGAVGPGEVVADLSLLAGTPVPYDATCATECDLAEVAEADVWARLESRPATLRRVLASVAARVESCQHRLIALSAGDLRHQVAMLLLDHTDGEKGSLRIAQSTIAELLGATRPSVNRVLKELETDGAIALAYRRVDVLDPERLRAAMT